MDAAGTLLHRMCPISSHSDGGRSSFTDLKSSCGAAALAKIREALALTYNPLTPNDQRVAAQKVRNT